MPGLMRKKRPKINELNRMYPEIRVRITYRDWLKDIYKGRRLPAFRGLIIGVATSFMFWMFATLYYLLH